MDIYNNRTLDEERALYGIREALVESCRFAGPADGESALKESENITVRDCEFQLRYPFWHSRKALVEDCTLTDTARAAFWYCEDITLARCSLMGIKALRECRDFSLEDCTIESMEFGWLSRGGSIKESSLVSEYPFFQAEDMRITGLTMEGKYSFQYVNDIEIRDSNLNTKDAFWHSRNVTVYDSIIKGEYLGWYSEGLTLVNCTIIGTQPLCYAKDLTLTDCRMIDCDLSFEKSEVNAVIKGHITSVKNPAGGCISAGSIGEVITDVPAADSCRIVTMDVTFSREYA